jgi:hypothetical protein
MKQNSQNILGRVKLAESSQEIDSLLKQGSYFKYASDRTRNRWKIAAKKRRMSLEQHRD